MKKLRLIFFSMICFWMLGFASAKADDDYEITKYEVNVDILDIMVTSGSDKTLPTILTGISTVFTTTRT